MLYIFVKGAHTEVKILLLNMYSFKFNLGETAHLLPINQHHGPLSEIKKKKRLILNKNLKPVEEILM